MQFVFGRLRGGTDEGTYVEDLIALIMSPQHAKAFLTPLVNMLLRFEDNFGPINIPESGFADAVLSSIRIARDKFEKQNADQQDGGGKTAAEE